jgi:hypothetical protein
MHLAGWARVLSLEGVTVAVLTSYHHMWLLCFSMTAMISWRSSARHHVIHANLPGQRGPTDSLKRTRVERRGSRLSRLALIAVAVVLIVIIGLYQAEAAVNSLSLQSFLGTRVPTRAFVICSGASVKSLRLAWSQITILRERLGAQDGTFLVYHAEELGPEANDRVQALLRIPGVRLESLLPWHRAAYNVSTAEEDMKSFQGYYCKPAALVAAPYDQASSSERVCVSVFCHAWGEVLVNAPPRHAYIHRKAPLSAYTMCPVFAAG